MKKIVVLISVLFALQLQAQNKTILPGGCVSNKNLLVFNPNSGKIFLYKEANFKGEVKILSIGNYTQTQLGEGWNNCISSIKVPNGYVMEVYLEDHFLGTSMALYGTKTLNIGSKKSEEHLWVGDYKELDHFWDDKISSLKIIKLIQ